MSITANRLRPQVLMADDDPDDCLLTRNAFKRSEALGELVCLENGDELIAAMRAAEERPVLVLLDLNMPKKGGLEILREIKSDPRLSNIPVVILTTSSESSDVEQSYQLGANSFITKPSTLQGYQDMVRSLDRYWFETVTLPHENS